MNSQVARYDNSIRRQVENDVDSLICPYFSDSGQIEAVNTPAKACMK